MSFDIHDPSKHEGSAEIQDVNPYHGNLVVPKDLFESITEGHYLPELVGAHDDTINANELLDSLVEKGCEDNQILGHAFDKLAHLVAHDSTEYNEDDDDMLLHDAPVSDIIDRLEQSMSPSQNSITAAQGLLHLQQMSEELAKEQLGDKISFSTESFEEVPANCDVHDDVLDVQLPAAQGNICDVAEEDAIDQPEVDENVEALKSSDQEPDCNPSDETGLTVETTDDHYNDLVEASVDEAIENSHNDEPSLEPEVVENQEFIELPEMCDEGKDDKDTDSSASVEDMPTDLSFKQAAPPTEHIISRDAETTEGITDNMSDKSDELPKDLSCHKRAMTPSSSPKRIDVPRPPSRESDAMQSPQPSGIPAVPSSPELFNTPHAKSNKSLFLETLLASPSPKMCFSSELTITKHQSEPLNLGKHRKSASPTVSSCSDEIKKMQKEYGEPEEKRIKKESAEAQAKVNKILGKMSEDLSEIKHKKAEKTHHKSSDELSPLKQLQILKSCNDFTVPDPLLVPKEKLNDIIMSPGREIPALLIQRPELRLPEAFAFPAILQDPDILVISLSQLESILENKLKKRDTDIPPHKQREHKNSYSDKNTAPVESSKSTGPADGPPKQIPSMEALAGDIDAATSAALNQMLWLPYLSQLEAAVACSQNADFLKALNTSGYPTHGSYQDLAQMFAPSNRFMSPNAFPMMPQMDYNNQLELAMWQEAMNQTNNAISQRSVKQNSAENQLKELAKAVDAQNQYLQSSKSFQNRSHSAARTSPIAHSYNVNSQRSAINHANQFFPSMYANMNSNIRPNVPLPGLQIPHYNPNMMAASRSGRSQHQQKSPTSPYFHNNNYLQSLKQPSGSRVLQSPTQKRSGHGGHEGAKDPRSNQVQSRPSSHSSTSQSPADDSQKPRISVKSLHNLLEPSQVSTHQSKRVDYSAYQQPSLSDLMAKPPLSHPAHNPSAAAAAAAAAAASHSAQKMRRQMADASLQRRMLGHDEGEVGSTTPHDEAAAPLHADPHTHLWHPLFGNQKGYNSPWNWTTVTVNGE